MFFQYFSVTHLDHSVHIRLVIESCNKTQEKTTYSDCRCRCKANGTVKQRGKPQLGIIIKDPELRYVH